MDLCIKGKLALVVGGSRGVGKAVAIELEKEGCHVVSVARTGEVQINMDLMQEGAERLCEKVLEFGHPEIIYYCMGGSWGGIKDWASLSDDWKRVWQFNLGFAIDLNRLLIPAMMEKKWGRIVMTSSDATKCNSGNPPYSASKFALEGYVKTVSKQLSPHNVILTAVAPGHVHTPGLWMYSQSEEWTRDYFRHHAPINRWARDEEIAKVVTFLCSEHSSYMAGSVVRADGGSR